MFEWVLNTPLGNEYFQLIFGSSSDNNIPEATTRMYSAKNLLNADLFYSAKVILEKKGPPYISQSTKLFTFTIEITGIFFLCVMDIYS